VAGSCGSPAAADRQIAVDTNRMPSSRPADFASTLICR
jgi:hypothetical protein